MELEQQVEVVVELELELESELGWSEAVGYGLQLDFEVAASAWHFGGEEDQAVLETELVVDGLPVTEGRTDSRSSERCPCRGAGSPGSTWIPIANWGTSLHGNGRRSKVQTV